MRTSSTRETGSPALLATHSAQMASGMMMAVTSRGPASTRRDDLSRRPAVSGRRGDDCFLTATHAAGAPSRIDAFRLNEAHGFMAHRLPVDSERPGEAVMTVQIGTGSSQESGDAVHVRMVRSMKAVRYWTFDIDAYDPGRRRARVRAAWRRLSQQARCATLPSTLPVESSGRMLLSQTGQSGSPLSSRFCARLAWERAWRFIFLRGVHTAPGFRASNP
jgi:hypothetical protein